jgi:Raf kinase inhibitor-like YbhB/YbcL family protein
MTFKLTSPAIAEGQPIPRDYTGDGRDVSPPLVWSDPPEGTRSFALVCEDPDAPRGTWTHWVVFNLPAEAHELSGGVPREETLSGPGLSGATQGRNDFGKTGYGGPAPPRGKPHRYFFKLYALDAPLDLRPGATRTQMLEAIKGHVLAEAHLMGTYAR